jgi:hypothetical protein
MKLSASLVAVCLAIGALTDAGRVAAQEISPPDDSEITRSLGRGDVLPGNRVARGRPDHPRPNRPPACVEPIGSISGVITDGAGAPAAGATVQAFSRGRGVRALAGVDGTYTIGDLCAGEYSVEAALATAGNGSYGGNGRGRSGRVAVTVDAPDVGGIDIVLTAHGRPARCSVANGSIAGRIVDAAGAAVEGARVSAQSQGPRVETTTADDGSYHLENLCPGSFRVSAHVRGSGNSFYDADGDGLADMVDLTAESPAATGIDIALRR